MLDLHYLRTIVKVYSEVNRAGLLVSVMKHLMTLKEQGLLWMASLMLVKSCCIGSS